MNIGELPWPEPVGAAMRVRHMQRELHYWAVSEADRRLMMCSTSFITRISSRLRGHGCGVTGALGPPESTGSARPLSPRMVTSWSFWGRCGSS